MENVTLAFSKRLREICAEKRLKPYGQQAALARLVGISQPGVKRWFDGAVMPETPRLIFLAKWAGVTYEWLSTGRGDKYSPGKESFSVNTPDEKLILQGFRAANKAQADMMLALARFVVQHKAEDT